MDSCSRCGTAMAEAHDGEGLCTACLESGVLRRQETSSFVEAPAAGIGAGTELGPYRIEGPIGAGGMGAVYKARDTRLNRTVAVKVSKAAFSARFRTEALAVAALNHPNICTLFDVGPDYLVMEYVEGKELSGPLPVPAAMALAGQIADALEHAHRQGVVHRDLKPSNILATKSGVKVLDFGLAKLPAAARADLSRAGTLDGTVIGTPAYMAPEQIEGKTTDERTDVFAFGLILYELLTGATAFERNSAPRAMAAILQSEPSPPSARKKDLPVALDKVVMTCLAKDPAERWQSMRELKHALAWASTTADPRPGSRSAPATSTREWIAWIVAGAAILALAAVIPRALRSIAVSPTLGIKRFEVPAPAKATEALYPQITPDGTALVFMATLDGVTSVWVRPLDSLDARPLVGTEGASDFVVSGDSRFVAFWAGDQIKRVPIGGGTALTICQAERADFGPKGLSREGTLLFAAEQRIYRVSVAGGTPVAVTKADAAGGWQRSPSFLPDGQHFVYLAEVATRGLEIRLASLDGGEPRTLFTSDTQAAYSPPGFLLFARETSLLAQRLDAITLTPVGEPTVVTDRVLRDGYWANFSVSENGVLVFQSGTEAKAQLTWFDRAGRPLETVGPPDFYWEPALSPDESRLAVLIGQGPFARLSRLSVFDLRRGSSTLVTREPRAYSTPLWSPDGRSILFAAGQAWPPSELHRHPADGTGNDEVLFRAGGPFATQDTFSDGRSLACLTLNPRTEVDISLLSLEGKGSLQALVNTPSHEHQARFSPDGRWLAYVSGYAPSPVYVQPHPPTGERWIVTSSGAQPRWRQDGKELFYMGPDHRLMAATVESTPSGFRAASVKPLFQTQTNDFSASSSFVVAANGQRFLVPSLPLASAVGPFNVVLDWSAEVGR